MKTKIFKKIICFTLIFMMIVPMSIVHADDNYKQYNIPNKKLPIGGTILKDGIFYYFDMGLFSMNLSTSETDVLLDNEELGNRYLLGMVMVDDLIIFEYVQGTNEPYTFGYGTYNVLSKELDFNYSDTVNGTLSFGRAVDSTYFSLGKPMPYKNQIISFNEYNSTLNIFNLQTKYGEAIQLGSELNNNFPEATKISDVVVYEDKAYMIDANKNLYSYDLISSNYDFVYKFKNTASDKFANIDNLIFLIDSSGSNTKVISYNIDTQEAIERFVSPVNSWFNLLTDNGLLYFLNRSVTVNSKTHNNTVKRIYLENVSSIFEVVIDGNMIGDPYDSSDESEIIVFRDNNLKQALISLGIDTNGDMEISASEALIPIELSLTNKSITYLDGIQYFKNVEDLMLSTNSIIDISFISQLTKIKRLDIDGNSISDISALENLKDLETLYAQKNLIEDLTPLKNLKKLKLAWFGGYGSTQGNPIKDASPLANIKSLENVNVRGSLINSLLPFSLLSRHGNLIALNVNDCPLWNSETPDAVHYAEYDFTVGSTQREVWLLGEPDIPEEEPEDPENPENTSSSDNVIINGEFYATVIDVEVPISKSYLVNPNAIVGEQFIAPDFTIINNTNAPVSASVNLFETAEDSPHKFTDVAPTHFTEDKWAKLNKEDSKNYIALALVIKDSSEWRNLEQTEPLYAYDVITVEEPIEIGNINPNSEVTLSFIAKHGTTFDSAIESEHNLGFLFSLLD